GEAAEHDRVGDPVGDRVEERAARPGAAAAPREVAVEQVAEPGEADADRAEEEVPGRDRDRRAEREQHSDDGERVGRDADATERAADRSEATFDACSPASIEHGVSRGVRAVVGGNVLLASASGTVEATTGSPAPLGGSAA